MVNHVRRIITFDDDIERARKQRKRTTENYSSVMECSTSGMNTLAARDTAKLHLRFFPRENAVFNGNEGATETAKVILDALLCKDLFREALRTYMSKNGCNPPHEEMLIRTRTHLTIVATADGTTKGALVQTARASPYFHGRAVHSDVAVRAQTGSRTMMSHITRSSTERSTLVADMTTRRGKRSRTTLMRTTEEKKNVGDDSVAEVAVDSNQEKTISMKQENSERSKVKTQKVDKGASHTEKRPQATTREGEKATERTAAKCTIMTMEAMLERWEHLSQKDPWYNRMYLAATRETIRSADLGHAESCGKTTQANKGENASSSSDEFEVVDETNIYPLMWKGKREEIRLTEADVMCLAVGKWLNDNVMDMYLMSIYEEQLQGKDTAAVHVCTTFWHPEVLANQKVDTVKRGWELRVKSRTTEIHRLCKNLEAAPVVLIPINHKHHWMLLIMLNVREFWTDCKCPDAVIVDSCDGYATLDWRALRTLMWHEYLNDKRRGPNVARQLVDKSWNTCKDVFGRELIHARSSQQSNREDCGVYVCCMAEKLITKLAHLPTENGFSKDDILEIVEKMPIDGRTVGDFRRRALDRITECAATAKDDGEGRNEGTCDEGQSYGEDASKEEEDSEKGYSNTKDSDSEVKEEEDISRSSSREERCSEDNTRNTSRKTPGGRSHGRRHDSNANKQLVLKEKAIEGRQCDWKCPTVGSGKQSETH
ncbi:hypothetical protein CBR_g40872 [Chara braunii]|uniref:Ubiquitin-like protease family profile domain-containing protein n=1 Tax=Chara braunii TaxID=69332 RepID=A0A388K289_CHABU|nr:hypothetical protein CBR_g40872 [Chara braunii]|eukprot:GBG64172.1 hypothetical protein CBR_g40872 [Chara braunii]